MVLRIMVMSVIILELCCCALGQKTNTNADPVHDIIAPNFRSMPFSSLATDQIKELDQLEKDLTLLSSGKSLKWCDKCTDGMELRTLAKAYFAKSKSSCSLDVKWDKSVIFHIKEWDSTTIEAPVLIGSSWYVYRHPWHMTKNDLVPTRKTGTGDPLIYGASQIVIIGIDHFKQGTKDSNGRPIGLLQSTYSMTVSPGVPENYANAGALFGGLTGVTSVSLGSSGSKGEYAYIAAGCPSGTDKLPFDLSVTATTQVQKQQQSTGDNTGKNPLQNATPGNVSCGVNNAADPSCTVTRTFTSKDREWWDVSLGMSIPGVRETTLSFATSAPNNVSSSVTRHTEVYAFADLFPFSSRLPKDSFAPHFAVGIPVTTKSLYRPFFGLSENVTTWTHLQKKFNLPVGVNFFGGVVLMKTPTNFTTAPPDQTSFNTALKYQRVIKGMYGIEVPVGSLLGKLGGKGGGGGSKNGSGNANGKKGSS